MTERRLDHLDPATIAALVDRTLDPAARAAAEAHLADCADCREVWVETSEMAGAHAGDAVAPGTAPIAARPRTRQWIYAATGLAAAAAIVLAVFSPQLFNRDASPDLRDLVRAVGENRRTEGRLAGGFKWGPVPSSTRGGQSDPDAALELAAADLRAAAKGSEDAAALGASAVAALVVGNVDVAIAELERAASLDGTKPELRSDLSAAYLEAHRQRGDARAAARALESADHALRLSPRMPEALFNRALALSALGRDDEARRAWQEYLDVDGASRWSAEARDRARPPS